jgi:hypothetical protein
MSLLEDLGPVLPNLRTAFLAFPGMPENSLGLSNGDVLRSETDDLGNFAPKGKEFPIFFDGEYVRCSPPDEQGNFHGPSWSVDQICSEIQDRGWWKVQGSIFDTPGES